MTRASEIMSGTVISVTPSTPISAVARVFAENEISGCPVVDYSGRLHGIISRTNIVDYALQRESHDLPPTLRSLSTWTGGGPADDPVESPEAQDLMSSDLVTVATDTPLNEVARLMHSERVHRVPVMDGPKVVGIITTLDVLGWLARRELHPPESH